MVIKVGVNGFGRVGRIVFRTCFQHLEVEVTAVNDPAVDIEYICYLIKYDSTHGKLRFNVTYKGNEIQMNGKSIRVFDQKQPGDIPWDTAGVQYVVEASGMFTTLEKASGHLMVNGVKRVILTAPSLDIPMLVLGVNNDVIAAETRVLSCGSSTLYCLAPLVKVLMDNFGVEEGFVTTVHAMTPSLKPLDGFCLKGKHWREHRSITQNIIPTATGACKALGRVVPAAKDRFAGLALRVPIADVSLLDISVRLTKNTTLAAIVESVEKASKSTSFNIITTTHEQNVSSDFLGDEHSCILDTTSSLQLKPDFFKLVCWYENEYSYACRVVDAILFSEKQLCNQCHFTSQSSSLRSKVVEKQDLLQQAINTKTKRESDDKYYEHLPIPKRFPSDTTKLRTVHLSPSEAPIDFIKVQERLGNVKREFHKMKDLTEGLLNTSNGNKNKLDLSSKFSTIEVLSSHNERKDIDVVETCSNNTLPKCKTKQHTTELFKGGDYKTINTAVNGSSTQVSKEEMIRLKSYEGKLMYSVNEIKKLFENPSSLTSLRSEGQLSREKNFTKTPLKTNTKESNEDSSGVDILNSSENVMEENNGFKESNNFAKNTMENQHQNTKLEGLKQPMRQAMKEYCEHTTVKANNKLEDETYFKQPGIKIPTRSVKFSNPTTLMLSRQITYENIQDININSSTSQTPTIKLHAPNTLQIIHNELRKLQSTNRKNQFPNTLSSTTDGLSKKIQFQSFPSNDFAMTQGRAYEENIQNISAHDMDATNVEELVTAVSNLPVVKSVSKHNFITINNNICNESPSEISCSHNNNSILCSNIELGKSKSDDSVNISTEMRKFNLKDKQNCNRLNSSEQFFLAENQSEISLVSQPSINSENISTVRSSSTENGISNSLNENQDTESRYKAIMNSVTSVQIERPVGEKRVGVELVQSIVAIPEEMPSIEKISKKRSILHVDDSELMKNNAKSANCQQSKLDMNKILYTSSLKTAKAPDLITSIKAMSLIDEKLKKRNIELIHDTNYDKTLKNHDKKSEKYLQKDADAANDSIDMIRSVTSISSTFYSDITSQQDIYDKLESPATSDSDNSFVMDAKKSQIISIKDVTNSLDDLECLDKICRIMETSDELSDKLFSTLDEEVKANKKSNKWSFKDLCEKIKLEEFCSNVFGE